MNPEKFPILYEDKTIVAIDKPGGILVHRSKEARGETRFVLQELAAQLDLYLYPVHRLDRPTSGVLIFAKTSAAAAELQQQMASPKTQKNYLTLVRGSTEQEFRSDRPLTDGRGKTLKPREASTQFVKLAEFARSSLLRATLCIGGRRHQIRRHLHHLAHQVIGDTTYGKGRINQSLRDEYGLPRLVLHAESIQLDRNDGILIQCALAEDLRAFLLRLPDCPKPLINQL